MKYNSFDGDCFDVYTADGIRQFQAIKGGLYGMNIHNKQTEFQFLETVNENKSNYTREMIARADAAKQLYGIVQHPSIPDYKNMICFGMIKNCPITVEDVETMVSIYGPDVAVLKGKTVRKQSPKIRNPNYISVPPEIQKIATKIVIKADIIYVNKCMFWFTMSRRINFLTIERVLNREHLTILKAMDNVISLYHNRGMRIKDLFVDPEFAPTSDEVARRGIWLNIASQSEHVAGIERKTRVLKEQVRARWSVMPYSKIPRIMVTELVKDVVAWLNIFLCKGGMSRVLGPRAIMTGIQFDYRLHCRVEFGQYCQVHEDRRFKNCVDMERTTDAIALRASGNLQGGYRFLNLNTGQVLLRHHFTIVPITQDVIDRVNKLRNCEVQPEGLDVYNLDLEMVGDLTNQDRELEGLQEDADVQEVIDVEPQYVPEIEAEDNCENEDDDEVVEIPGVIPDEPEVVDLTNEQQDENIRPVPPNLEENQMEEEAIIFEEEDQENRQLFPKPEQEQQEERIPEDEGYRTGSGRRVRFVQDYILHLDSRKRYDEFAGVHIDAGFDYNCHMAPVLAFVLQQMHINKGIRKFGQKGIEAGLKEMLLL